MGLLPEQPALFLSFMTSNWNTTSNHESQPTKYLITSLNLVK